MNMKRRARVTAQLTATALLAGGTLTMGAGEAAAGAEAMPTFTFEQTARSSNGSFNVAVYTNHNYSGKAEWNADPVSGAPGDALRSYDHMADGWSVKAILYKPYRTASTQGHPAPTWTGWRKGNIAEGKKVQVRICMVRGYNSSCSDYYAGKA